MPAPSKLPSFSVGLPTMLLAVVTSHAAKIVPVSQFRTVMTDSVVAPTVQQDIEFFSAPDFGLFDMSAKAAISNSNAVSDTTAGQLSTTDDCAVIGSGSSFAHSLASAAGFHGYSNSSSVCRVIFDLEETTECLIAGTLQAESNADGKVILQAFPNTLLFQRAAQNGELGVHHRATLDPGRYIITFSSFAGTSSNSFGEMTAEGDYDMKLTLCFIPADVTVDGTVDVDDLLTVINAWGNCPSAPESCAADIDLNNLVDVDDLLAVINAWGS